MNLIQKIKYAGKRHYVKMMAAVFFLVMLVGVMTQTANVFAMPASSKEEVSERLPMASNGDQILIGRYQFNYTGNWNYFSNFNAVTMQEEEVARHTAITGFQNSSKATLSNVSGATGIVKAYLIWQTRKPYEAGNGSANHVVFAPGGGRYQNIYPDYVYNDNRKFSGWGDIDQRRLYTMVTDITPIIQQYGYGDYYVANIPEHHTIDAGGDNVCSWQLVVVEEGESFPVRALTMKVGATWRFGDPAYGDSSYLDTYVSFNNGIKSKSAGNVSGQLLFGCANDHDSMYTSLQETLYTQSGSARTRVDAGTLTGGGLYRNAGRQMGEYGIVANLSDISSGLGNDATVLGAEVNNIFWNTLLYVGTAVDIAFPDFTAVQKTTVNSATSVTVTGDIRNVSQAVYTGIYDGKLVVTLDTALTPGSMTAVVDGNKTIQGTVSGNTVTFTGEAIKNIMKDSRITYTITCSTNASGKTRFDNSDSFSGKLRADGVDTNYWIDNACISSSYGVPKYKVTLHSGTGIDGVTGAGEYTYGAHVSVGAQALTGYHWLNWTGSYNTTIQSYAFSMPAQNIELTANGEANSYTIHFEPNGGAAVTPIPDITARYDEDITLPDATGAYVKYTLDGTNITNDILSGAIVLSEDGTIMTRGESGELIAQDGSITMPDGTVMRSDGTVIAPDGTVTAPNGTVTMPNGTVKTPEGAVITSDGVVMMPDGTTHMLQETDGALEQALEVPAEPQADKKAYLSVFMGWALADKKDEFTAQWSIGEPFKVSAIADAAGITDKNGAVITLYAVWDDCPWIHATNLYYTLEQAQSGFITADEILTHQTALDREDGSPIAPGVHENGTSFTIPDYAPTDFTQFQREGGCTENLTVVDSAGNTYMKQIMVWVVDTTPTAVKPEGTTRFINEYYYNQPYELGGLEDTSIWKTDPEYVATLQEAFTNMKNGTPQQSYYFTHETILEMKEYMEVHGYGNSKEADALSKFYEKFCAPNRVK